MSWERFEDRMMKGGRELIVTISGSYLYLNSAVTTQVIRKQGYVDLLLDRQAKRIGMNFSEQPDLCLSYRIYRPQGRNRTARICLRGFLKFIGPEIIATLKGRRFRAALHNDPLERIWWFSIAPLFDGQMHRRDAEKNSELSAPRR